MNEGLVFGAVVLASILLVCLRGQAEQRKLKKLVAKQISGEYGAAPMKFQGRQEAAVRGSYLHAKAGFCLDDITWNDLDMDAVFRRFCYSRCSAGSEELYRMLRCPVMEQAVLEERNALADTFMERKELRERLSLELYEIGFTGKYALADYLAYLGNLGQRGNGKHILRDCLYIPAVAILFFQPSVGITLLFLTLAVNIFTYFKEKGEVNPYLVSFAYILRMLRGAGGIAGILEKAEKSGSLKAGDAASGQYFIKYREILQKDVKELESFRRFSGIALSMGNPAGGAGPLDILFDYLKMALHLDLMKFNQMLKVVGKKEAVIQEMVLVVGILDACLSIAYARASLQEWCRPERSCAFGIRAEDIYHPLLTEPVKNSIQAKRGVLVTGSNASGKSTFLKTVALGAVLSQTICTVPAKRFSAPFYRVMTSMALRDNLTGGESYFMAEIRALKRILDACGENVGMEAGGCEADAADVMDKADGACGQGPSPVLCFVDEVLRGTNTVERIAASSRILKSLTGRRVLCFAATHDIELTHLLEKEYDNYHFEETIERGDISFNYLLKEGRAQSRNAIRLLEVMGYDKDVTKEAELLAEHFLETGEWRE